MFKCFAKEPQPDITITVSVFREIKWLENLLLPKGLCKKDKYTGSPIFKVKWHGQLIQIQEDPKATIYARIEKLKTPEVILKVELPDQTLRGIHITEDSAVATFLRDELSDSETDFLLYCSKGKYFTLDNILNRCLSNNKEEKQEGKHLPNPGCG